jgi:ribosomal protein S18 acetylase RimI-like enzyme
MVEIRKATLADEEDVAVLIRGGDVNPVSWYSTLRKMIASPEWTFLLAEEGAKHHGLLTLLILPSLYHGGNYASITELIVSKEAQRKGIGQVLVEEAKRLARTMGCEALDVSVEVDNEQAKGFYEKLGFKKKHADYGMDL